MGKFDFFLHKVVKRYDTVFLQEFQNLSEINYERMWRFSKNSFLANSQK